MGKLYRRKRDLLIQCLKETFGEQIEFMGANQMQTIKAFKEAESYNGPSIIIAYCPCAEHGIKGGLISAPTRQKDAVACGYTSLYRFDPRLEKPLQIDSTKTPDWSKFESFLMAEARYFNLPRIPRM